MRVVYLDCATGLSGDMTLAALIDAGVEIEALRRAIDSLGLPGVRLEAETVRRCGFRATHVRILHPEQHAHRGMTEIRRLIDHAAALTPRQRQLALQIFQAIGEAEAHVHGVPLEAVHFHEVGAIDSICDIVGAAVGFDLLKAERIVASRIPTGHGSIRIAHGVCSLPAPATAELLRGIPLVDVPVAAELTTPTGAAIVKTLVSQFGGLPEMTIDNVGYGAGTRDFPDRPNILRLFVGQAVPSPNGDIVCLLETNLDDVSAEIIGYTRQRLAEAGALEVYTTSIQMKKDRPGVLLSLLCRPAQREALEEILFAETGTFGVRWHTLERSTRERCEHSVETPWGPVQGKLGWRPTGATVFTPEFAACARVAQTHGVPLRDVYRAAEAAWLDFAPLEIPTTEPARDHSHSHDHSSDHDHDHRHDHGHDHGHGH